MRGARLALACVLAAALAGCARREGRHSPPVAGSLADSLVTDFRTAMARPAQNDQVAEWIGLWRSADPAFTLDSLAWGPAHALDVSYARACRPCSLASPRDPKFVASPDGALELDPNLYFEFDTGRGLALWDADAAIELFDVRAESSWVLAFCGTSCRHDAGAWIGPRRFAVAGISSNDSLPELLVPRVILVDVDRRMQVSGAGRGPGVDAAARDRYDAAFERAWARRYARRRPA